MVAGDYEVPSIDQLIEIIRLPAEGSAAAMELRLMARTCLMQHLRDWANAAKLVTE